MLAPRAVSGPPLGRSRVPLGPRLTPTEVQGAKSWFVGPPPGFPNEVILASSLFELERHCVVVLMDVGVGVVVIVVGLNGG